MDTVGTEDARGVRDPLYPLRGNPQNKVLTLPSEERETLVNAASWMAWPGWERFTLGCCAAFHFLIGTALLFAPVHQVVNAGTQPLFEFAPRWAWGGACLIAALSALLLFQRRTMTRQMATWYVVIPLGFAWSGTFFLALMEGEGSAIGAVVFPFLYLWFGAAAIRIGLRKR